MPTLLATSKMSPELRARVQASVQGRRAAPGARLAPRSLGLLRIAVLLTIAGSVGWLFLLRQRAGQERANNRAALLERIRRHSSPLTAAERALPERVQPWLERNAQVYEGDFVAGELRAGDGFATILARPSVYVRGPLASFASVSGVKEIAATSSKDAFVLCLLDPPAARSEKTLLAKARAAYGGGEEATAHVQRLYHALAGLPFLAPAWSLRVHAAKSEHEIERLERTFNRAPLAAARLAAKSSLLLFVMDEADGSGPTELDGERAHHGRVGLVDLASDKLLLRMRRHVDPSWLSAASRAEYASAIDACALALDVRAGVLGEAGTAL